MSAYGCTCVCVHACPNVCVHEYEMCVYEFVDIGYIHKKDAIW